MKLSVSSERLVHCEPFWKTLANLAILAMLVSTRMMTRTHYVRLMRWQRLVNGILPSWQRQVTVEVKAESRIRGHAGIESFEAQSPRNHCWVEKRLLTW